MLSPSNQADLVNKIRVDFGDMVENISAPESVAYCIRDIYKMYKKRVRELSGATTLVNYAPCYIVIHNMQRFSSLFENNPRLALKEEKVEAPVRASRVEVPAPSTNMKESIARANQFFEAARTAPVETKQRTESIDLADIDMPDNISFVDAFNVLLMNGGEVGIHFIFSIDNPVGIKSIKNSIIESVSFKVFTKGVDPDALSQVLSDYKAAGSLNNAKVALMAYQGERVKFRAYRFDDAKDSAWYYESNAKYKALGGDVE